MPELLLVALLIAWVIGQRVTLRWVARRWADERLGNLAATLMVLGSSSVGLGVLFAVAVAILHPSSSTVGMLLTFGFIALVIFGFGMTAATYASTHGVREHLRAERAKQEQARKP